MISRILGVSLVLALLLGPASATTASAASTGNSAPQPGKVVSTNPSDNSPGVMDGTVLSIAQIGSTIVVGGTFTTVRNAGSTVDIPRSNVFAFDATTGLVKTDFAPNPTGSVYKVLPAADGTFYLGGDFFNLAYQGTSVAVSRLVKMNLQGALVSGFAPGSWDGQVRDLELTGNRLWVAGKFTYVQGKKQKALATINATTGAYDPFFKSVFAGLHRSGYSYDVTDVLSITTNPANGRLVAVGNFTSVDGSVRSQIAMFDISGASSVLANWYTKLYESSCAPQFDTTMTDASYSPDGSYFAVSTTGSYGGSASLTSSSGCDVVARFESSGSGTSVRPTWTAYTGGDTTWTIEVTANAIYAGGHQRWQNNPTGSNAVGQGAVERTGIAALDPVNGMAYSWNPTRTRGVGIKDMLATTDGLYVGSDTTVFANETHYRLAYLPLAGGKTLPTYSAVHLPASVVTVASGAASQRTFDGSKVTAGPTALSTGSAFTNSVGAFMISGTLYTAFSDGSLTKRTWDGTTFGAASAVDAADQLAKQTDWHGTDVPKLTSLFYDPSSGRIYYTLSGLDNLYYRGFEPESDIVGQIKSSSAAITGLSYKTVTGAFLADGKLYFTKADKSLSSATWSAGAPVSGTVKTVLAAGSAWTGKPTFVYQGKANAAPTAALAASCTGSTCAFDASDSVDLDGTIASYSWDFGDGSTSSDESPSHTYDSTGDKSVTLTVTDDGGDSATATKDVAIEDVSSDVTPVDTATSSGNRSTHTVKVPDGVEAGDQLVLFFTGNTTSPTYSGPSGWDQVETKSGSGAVGYVWSRTATADSAGSTVTVTSSAAAKDAMTLAAYRGGSVKESASTLDGTSATVRTTPAVDASDSHQWLISYWSDKGSSTTAWSLPSGVTKRDDVFGSGSGHTSAVLADSDGAVGSGAQGRLAATTDQAGSAALTFSLLIG